MSHRFVLFIYGTLRDRDIRNRIIGRECSTHRAVIEQSALRRVVCARYPTIIDDCLSHVEGEVIEITAEEFEKLDRYEGPEYRRERRTVLLDGVEKSCWVYRMCSKFSHCISDTAWSFENFIQHDKTMMLKEIEDSNGIASGAVHRD